MKKLINIYLNEDRGMTIVEIRESLIDVSKVLGINGGVLTLSFIAIPDLAVVIEWTLRVVLMCCSIWYTIKKIKGKK